MLDRALATTAAAELRFGSGERAVPARLVGLDKGNLRFEVLAPGTPAMLPDRGGGHVSLHIANRAWSFEAELTREGGDVQVSRPTEIRPVQLRAGVRIAAPAGMSVLFSLGETVLRRNVLDLSGRGLGVALQDDPGEPGAGAALAEVRFSLPIGPAICGAAVVRHVRTLPTGQRQAGLDLIGMSPADSRRLDAWVRGQTRTGRRESARRAAEAFADTRVLFGAGALRRTRAVLDCSARGVTLAGEATDRDLAPGALLPGVELHTGEETVIRGNARVVDVVSHRGRPVQVQLAWERLDEGSRAVLEELLARILSD